jgi:hypothetical protein
MPADPAYRIPISNGWHTVIIMTGEHDYGGAIFDITFQKGSTEETKLAGVEPETFAGGNERAVALLAYVHVTNNLLSIDFTTTRRGEVGGLCFDVCGCVWCVDVCNFV